MQSMLMGISFRYFPLPLATNGTSRLVAGGRGTKSELIIRG